MINTVEQFKNQNAYWHDKYYHYAIHITDGGATYLYQVECKGKLKDSDLQYARMIRLDGCDITSLTNTLRFMEEQ